MKDSSQPGIWTIGLAIFSMLFGAGNIIYPIKCGVVAGSQNIFGVAGFILTAVFLPIIGLITMILFEGNYKRFFNRLGKIPGAVAMFYCLLILGPLIAMPRCITMPYEIFKTFAPSVSLLMFSTIFAFITFLMTYKESRLLSLLGNIISPLLLGSLGIIAVKGLWQADTMIPQSSPGLTIFLEQLAHGFQTLDLVGALFFAYIVLRILKSNRSSQHVKIKELAFLSLQGGLIAGFLLMLVYGAFSYLAAYYGHLVQTDMNGAEMFRIICLHILNSHSMFVIMMAVMMACLSTITALAAVFAEYLHADVFNKKISFAMSLAITMIITTIISNFGLTNIINFSLPFILIGYPILTMITLCNLAYILFGFEYIQIPVGITAIISTSIILYF